MKWSKIVFLGMLFSTLAAWSAVLDLSQQSLYKFEGSLDPYAKLVSSIKPGDTVTFPDGAKFTIDSKVGEGRLSYIFSVRERPHQVLRLAKKLSSLFALRATIKGYEELKESGIRTVEIDPQSNEYYVLAERVSQDYLTIAEMILGRDIGKDKFLYNESNFKNKITQHLRSLKVKASPRLDPEEREEMLAAFWLFLKSISPYYLISDLHEANVVYDRNEGDWIILDWASGNLPLKEKFHLKDSVGKTVDDLFLFLDEALDFGFSMPKDVLSEYLALKEKSRSILIKEKAKIIQEQEHLRIAKIRCDLLLEGKTNN